MIVLGLTGSIGMGKTTTAAMFRNAGAPVYDADASVHVLYAAAGAAVRPVGQAFPGVVVHGAVDRALLSARVTGDPAALRTLETIVHPLLGRHRADFLDQARLQGARVAVLDIPLLFETGAQALVDAVVVVSAPLQLQHSRVLARPGMDQAKLDTLIARQTPDHEKRRRADFLIDTGEGLDAARGQVDSILRTVMTPGWAPRRSDALDPRREQPHS